jgi:hypothetical protein
MSSKGIHRESLEGGGASRLRLFMPDEMDALLVQLASLTGRSKASFALEALSWYLPKLHALAVDLLALRGGEHGRAARDREGSPGVWGRVAPHAEPPRAQAAPGVSRAVGGSAVGVVDALGHASLAQQDRSHGRASPTRSTEQDGVSASAVGLSRQQRRALERQSRKAGKG